MKNFFENMDSDDKVMAVMIISTGAAVIVYFICATIAGMAF